ncbi:PAS domain-containing protein [Ferrovibrio sp.]|uniref:PAS domain-containing protein n=1 Tax=Ferrovibrio sp. TaxID=1917215 RepID=UPI0035B1D12F
MDIDSTKQWRYCIPLAEADLDQRLRGLLDFWAAKRGQRRFLSRADINPLELRHLLGHILLVDVVRQADRPSRFRYRLFGTEFVHYHGADQTGRWLDEIGLPGFREELLRLYTAVAEEGVMRSLTYDYTIAEGVQRFQALLLPLSGDGQVVDMVFGCGVPVETPASAKRWQG